MDKSLEKIINGTRLALAVSLLNPLPLYSADSELKKQASIIQEYDVIDSKLDSLFNKKQKKILSNYQAYLTKGRNLYYQKGNRVVIEEGKKYTLIIENFEVSETESFNDYYGEELELKPLTLRKGQKVSSFEIMLPSMEHSLKNEQAYELAERLNKRLKGSFYAIRPATIVKRRKGDISPNAISINVFIIEATANRM